MKLKNCRAEHVSQGNFYMRGRFMVPRKESSDQIPEKDVESTSSRKNTLDCEHRLPPVPCNVARERKSLWPSLWKKSQNITFGGKCFCASRRKTSFNPLQTKASEKAEIWRLSPILFFAVK